MVDPVLCSSNSASKVMDAKRARTKENISPHDTKYEFGAMVTFRFT